MIKGHVILIIGIFVGLGLGESELYGTEFVLGIPENKVFVHKPEIRIHVTSVSDVTITVIMRVPHLRHRYPEEIFDLEPGETYVGFYGYALHMFAKNGVENKAIYISSNGNITVSAGSIGDLSSDTFVALPMAALSTKYYAATYIWNASTTTHTQGPAFIGITGVEDFTQVMLYTKKPVYAIEPLVVRLNKYQTYMFQSHEDITGSKIESNKPIAVVVGSVWSSIKAEYMGDYLIEQALPLYSWAEEFFTVPIATRKSGDIFRVVAKDNKTRVRLLWHDDLNQQYFEVFGLNEGDFREFESPSTRPLRVLANRGIWLLQYTKSYSADGVRNSDPFMTTVPPVRQYQNSYRFLTYAPFLHFRTPFTHYISLTINASYEDGLRINGSIILPGDIVNRWYSIDNTDYMGMTFRITDSAHTLSHKWSNVNFGVILYGFNFQEGYAQVVGHRLKHFEVRPCKRTFVIEADYFDNDCDGRFEEERFDEKDNDRDGEIDEDLIHPTASYPPTTEPDTTEMQTTTPLTTLAETTTMEISTVAETTVVTTEEKTTLLSLTTEVSTEPVELENLVRFTTQETVTTEPPTTEVTTFPETTEAPTVKITTQYETTEAITLPETTEFELTTMELTTADMYGHNTADEEFVFPWPGYGPVPSWWPTITNSSNITSTTWCTIFPWSCYNSTILIPADANGTDICSWIPWICIDFNVTDNTLPHEWDPFSNDTARWPPWMQPPGSNNTWDWGPGVNGTQGGSGWPYPPGGSGGQGGRPWPGSGPNGVPWPGGGKGGLPPDWKGPWPNGGPGSTGDGSGSGRWPPGQGPWQNGSWPGGLGPWGNGSTAWPNGPWPNGSWPNGFGPWPNGSWPSGFNPWINGSGPWPSGFGPLPNGSWPNGFGPWPNGSWPSGFGPWSNGSNQWPNGPWFNGSTSWPGGRWPNGFGPGNNGSWPNGFGPGPNGTWPNGFGPFPNGSWPSGFGPGPNGTWPNGFGPFPNGSWPSGLGPGPNGTWPNGFGPFPNGSWPSGFGPGPNGTWPNGFGPFPNGSWPSGLGPGPNGTWPNGFGPFPNGSWPRGLGPFPNGSWPSGFGPFPNGSWPSGLGPGPNGAWPNGFGPFPNGSWPNGFGPLPNGSWPNGSWPSRPGPWFNGSWPPDGSWPGYNSNGTNGFYGPDGEFIHFNKTGYNGSRTDNGDTYNNNRTHSWRPGSDSSAFNDSINNLPGSGSGQDRPHGSGTDGSGTHGEPGDSGSNNNGASNNGGLGTNGSSGGGGSSSNDNGSGSGSQNGTDTAGKGKSTTVDVKNTQKVDVTTTVSLTTLLLLSTQFIEPAEPGRNNSDGREPAIDRTTQRETPIEVPIALAVCIPLLILLLLAIRAIVGYARRKKSESSTRVSPEPCSELDTLSSMSMSIRTPRDVVADFRPSSSRPPTGRASSNIITPPLSLSSIPMSCYSINLTEPLNSVKPLDIPDLIIHMPPESIVRLKITS